MNLISDHSCAALCLDVILNLYLYFYWPVNAQQTAPFRNGCETQQLIQILIWSVEKDGEKRDRMDGGWGLEQFKALEKARSSFDSHLAVKAESGFIHRSRQRGSERGGGCALGVSLWAHQWGWEGWTEQGEEVLSAPAAPRCPRRSAAGSRSPRISQVASSPSACQALAHQPGARHSARWQLHHQHPISSGTGWEPSGKAAPWRQRWAPAPQPLPGGDLESSVFVSLCFAGSLVLLVGGF